MKWKFLFSLTVLTICGLAYSHAATLVTNGSFEQGPGSIGSFNGWQTMLSDAATFVDSSGQTGLRAGQASDGLWSAYFGSTASSGGASISQALTTAAGQVYVLTFDLANDNGGQPARNSFSVFIDGSSIFSASNSSSQNYLREQLFFTALSNGTTLAFSGYNDQGYLQLDNVAVSAVPEPSCLALYLAGSLVTCVVLKQRR